MGPRATEFILKAASDGVIAVQVIGEFLRVMQRRAPAFLKPAISQAALHRATFLTPATTDTVMIAAATLAQDHDLQLWDAVICAASLQAGAKILLSEDLQDGRVIETMRILNPLLAANATTIAQLFET